MSFIFKLNEIFKRPGHRSFVADFVNHLGVVKTDDCWFKLVPSLLKDFSRLCGRYKSRVRICVSCLNLLEAYHSVIFLTCPLLEGMIPWEAKGLLPIIDYTERPRPKGVHFSGWRYKKW